MKAENYKQLLENYRAGKTSTEEEQQLFNAEHQRDSRMEAWSTFVNAHQNQPPAAINEHLWTRFQRKKAQPKFRLTYILPVAASLILLVSVFLGTSNKKQSPAEKEQLLQQAVNLFEAPQETEVQQVFYENELIVVYTTSE
ncbi:MAG: hypothetical protein KTR13_07830 [Saprospiraceae bacterium]|nr:hypothetical protein [Saprospiraceae bacterium]